MIHSLDRLSERERDFLILLAQGHTAKTIARSRGLSVNVVNEHLRSARRKTDASSSRELARLLVAAPLKPPQENWDKLFGVEAPAASMAEPALRGAAMGARTPRTIWRTAMILAILVAAGVASYHTSVPNLAEPAKRPIGGQTAVSTQVERPDIVYQVLFKVDGETVAAPTVAGQFGREVRVELPDRMRAVVFTTAPDQDGLSHTSAIMSVFEEGAWRIVKEMSMKAQLTITPSFELSVDGTPYRFVIMPRQIVPAAG